MVSYVITLKAAPKPRRRATSSSCQNPLSAPNVGAQPTGGIPRTISADGASLCNSDSTAVTPALASTALTSTLASTHASTTFATATATAITASVATLALASTTLASALAFFTLATDLASATPAFTTLAAACFHLFHASFLAFLACLWVPTIPWPAPNVGAQPTGVEVYRTASADSALLCVSNSPAVAAAVTPSAVTAVAAPVEADLRAAGLDLR